MPDTDALVLQPGPAIDAWPHDLADPSSPHPQHDGHLTAEHLPLGHHSPQLHSEDDMDTPMCWPMDDLFLTRAGLSSPHL